MMTLNLALNFHSPSSDTQKVVSFHQLLCWTKMSSLMEQKCFASLASRYSTVFGSWSGATAIMWISHAWSLSILSAPCGTFLPMMKCYCCQRQTFSLYQSPSWQPSLLRKTWDTFKVRTFSTRSGEPNFFPIYCSTTSFPLLFRFITNHKAARLPPAVQWEQYDGSFIC